MYWIWLAQQKKKKKKKKKTPMKAPQNRSFYLSCCIEFLPLWPA
jgi:hypothetical protein